MNRFDDMLGRADLVRRLDHGLHALGMDEHLDPRELVAELGHVGRLEHLVDRTMSLQSKTRLSWSMAAGCYRRGSKVPYRHLGRRDSHSPRGNPAQVLVGKKRTRRLAKAQSSTAGVRAGAGDPPCRPQKRLQVGRRVDVVGIRSSVSSTSPRSDQAASTESGRHVGMDRSGKDPRRLPGAKARQRFSAMKWTPRRRSTGRIRFARELAELVTVTTEVRETNDLVLLMVSQDQERIAEPSLIARIRSSRSDSRRRGRVQRRGWVPGSVRSA